MTEATAKHAPDCAYAFINGRLLTEQVFAETWTDSAGRHLSGEILAFVDAAPEFAFEAARIAGVPLIVDMVRGGSGERIRFTGRVSRCGLRQRVSEPLVMTFQIDETSEVTQ